MPAAIRDSPAASDVIFPGQRLLLPGPAPVTRTGASRTAAGAVAGAVEGQRLRTSVHTAADANRAAVTARPAPDPAEVEQFP